MEPPNDLEPPAPSHRLAVPALLTVFALAAAGCALFTTRMTEWVVMTDELQYAKLALAIGDDLSLVPRLHGAYYGSHSQLYPLLIAPFFQLFDTPQAFRAVHAWNAVLMASTCFPCYLLTRTLMPWRLLAVLVAALCVAVPWMALSTLVLTDVAAYPAFVWAVLAMHRAVTRRGVVLDLLALAAISLAFAARTQFIVLAVVFPVVVVVHECLYAWHGDERRTGWRAIVTGLRRATFGHPPLAVLVALSPVLYGFAGFVSGSYARVLGELSLVGVDGLTLTAVRHLAVVAVAIGALPFILALAFALGELRRPSTVARHAYAVLLAVLTPFVLLSVAYFIVRFAAPDRLYDRYLMYLAPLLFVGMAAQLSGARSKIAGLTLAAVAFIALTAVVPFTTPSLLIAPETPASVFHRVFDGRSWQLGKMVGISELQPRPVIIAAVLVAVAALALAQRRLSALVVAPVVCLLLLGFNLAQTRYVFQAMLASQIGAPSGHRLAYERRDWIDNAVPRDASVALISSLGFDDFTTARIWWEAEFWNTTVDRAFAFGDAGPVTPFQTGRTMAVNNTTGRVTSSEPRGGAPTPFLVIGPYETRFRPASRTLAETGAGMELLQAELPYRAEWVTEDLVVDGWIVEGSPAKVRVFGPPDGRPRAIRLEVAFDLPAYPPRPPRFVLAAGDVRRTGTLQALGRARASIDVCVAARETEAVTISGRGNVSLPDGRKPAVHVVAIDSQPIERPCPRRPASG